jgi:hypothetical protein
MAQTGTEASKTRETNAAETDVCVVALFDIGDQFRELAFMGLAMASLNRRVPGKPLYPQYCTIHFSLYKPLHMSDWYWNVIGFWND